MYTMYVNIRYTVCMYACIFRTIAITIIIIIMSLSSPSGMVKYVNKYGISGKSMIAISSGANMDFDRLRFVSERADSSETLMSVTIPEEVRLISQSSTVPL
jgi:hypothetical protein